MKYSYLITIVIILLTISCNVHRYDSEGAKTILCIDLLGGFYKDTLSIFCNKELILSDIVVTSETEYGFSRVRVEFFEDLNGKQYIHTLVRSKLETKSVTPLMKDTVAFIFNLNTFSRETVKDTLKVALPDGKFIGVSKIDFKRDTSINSIKLVPATIEITQSHNRLIFH